MLSSVLSVFSGLSVFSAAVLSASFFAVSVFSAALSLAFPLPPPPELLLDEEVVASVVSSAGSLAMISVYDSPHLSQV